MNIGADYAITFTKPLTNVGALFDVPTGNFIKGPKGEYILNGGISNITGIVGKPNNFKSSIMHYLMLSAANNVNASELLAPMHTYDTEENMALDLDKFNRYATKFKNIPEDPIYDPQVWSLVTKSKLPAEEWYKEVVKKTKEKVASKKNFITHDAFINKYTKKPIVLPKPNFVEIDSLSELEATGTLEMLEKKGLEDTNMIFMGQGLARTKIIKDLTRLSHMGNTNFLLTAHLGEEFNIPTGPMGSRNKKQLQFLKQGDKIKGVPEKFLFLSTHFWLAANTSVLRNQNTGLPEYPNNESDVSTDLNLVSLIQLRSKTGPSGIIIKIVVSQREGVLPHMSQFHYLKEMKYGIGGNPRSYWVEFYPEVKLQRTTVRKKIDEDPKLRRAIELLSQIRQMQDFFPVYKNYYLEPEEIYKKIKEQGYDWNDILETRGWWTIKQYDKKLPNYLSALDLLRMAKGEYKPYWLKNKKEETGGKNEKTK